MTTHDHDVTLKLALMRLIEDYRAHRHHLPPRVADALDMRFVDVVRALGLEVNYDAPGGVSAVLGRENVIDLTTLSRRGQS